MGGRGGLPHLSVAFLGCGRPVPRVRLPAMINRLAPSLLILCLVLGCDKSDDGPNIVERGVSAAKDASAIAATDAEQKIDLAVNLINLGKLADAENLLNQIAPKESVLSPAARAKFADAQAKLAQAKH